MQHTDAPANLASTFVVLNPKFNAESVAVSDSIYAELDECFDNFKGLLLVSSHRFEDDWPTWEVHRQGDAEFVMRQNGVDSTVRLNSPGAFVVVPRNTWHTAIIHAPSTMIFVTPGQGTENRELPPG